jgi:hypothetical protein
MILSQEIKDYAEDSGLAMYAVRDTEGVVVSIFLAENLAEAVKNKHEIQDVFNKRNNADYIFNVGQATPKEIREFVPAGFVVGSSK